MVNVNQLIFTLTSVIECTPRTGGIFECKTTGNILNFIQIFSIWDSKDEPLLSIALTLFYVEFLTIPPCTGIFQN